MSELKDFVDTLDIADLREVIDHSRRRLSSLLVGEQAPQDAIDGIIMKFMNSKQVWEGDIASVYDAGGGVAVIPSVIAYKNQAGSHTCVQATVSESVDTAANRATNHWAWDSESPTYRGSSTVRIGAERRSISCHQLVEGMIVSFHSRTFKSDTRRHERSLSETYVIRLDDNGEINMDPVPMEWANLPLPPSDGQNL